jgi:hypothetical protein
MDFSRVRTSSTSGEGRPRPLLEVLRRILRRMSFTVPLAIYGAIPAIVLLFVFLPPHRACIWAYLLSALFLPMAGFSLPGVPNVDKNSVPNFAVIISICIFDPVRLTKARLRWFDLPMLSFLCAYFMSAITNDVGNSLGNSFYAGLSLLQGLLFIWGIPYFVARLYLDSYARFIELAQVVVIGGLIYIPLCLFEVRFSPQLHHWIYGYHQHSFVQSMRGGGFRPTVFMQHGLGVGMWMTLTSLIGVTLWWSNLFPKWLRGFEKAIIGLFLITSLLVKSTGALLLLFGGLAIQAMSGVSKTRIFYFFLLIAPVAYCSVRVSGVWRGEILSDTMGLLVSEGRLNSMLGRIQNEDLLIQKALQKPLFGWSGWDRSNVYNEQGRRMTTQDGMWIITFGIAGLIGLGGFLGIFLLPAFGVFVRGRANHWERKQRRLCTVVAIGLCLLALDFLMNAMPNPIYMLLCGALSNVVFLTQEPTDDVVISEASELTD